MSYPIDLSITGKPSPRVEHPSSAGKRSQTPLNINRTRSLQSDVFATNKDENSGIPKQSKLKVATNKREEAPNIKSKPDVRFKKGDDKVIMFFYSFIYLFIYCKCFWKTVFLW